MDSIVKISIANGIFWIDIPEVNLKILCGTPADSIKHLMKRGLLLQRESKGVKFETGPNAILLSDIMLQNGSFSNMGEFPVLQMLYRQGMIIPNHPNNSGKKPLLIGSGEQIESQMLYIYRGNYGLTSIEEIIECGYSEEEALALMNIKLKFAFGSIKSSDEFIDSCIVEDSKTEIRDGVFIERIESNIFKIDYKDQSQIVDLNLKDDEHYPSPYPLGFYNIKRDYFGIIHAGEGDGWDPTRPCMSSILLFQGKIYLIDAGPNIERNLLALGIGVNEIEGIFHTHSHDDHFAGIPALLRGDRKIKYFTTPLVRSAVTKKLSSLLWIDEARFEKFFDICDLKEDEWNNIDGLEVMPIYSPHPVETSPFYFRALWQGGYKTYGHLADITSDDVLKNMIRDDDTKPGISKKLYHKVKENYLRECDIKKIDVGGGMIHGDAEDFKNDKSKKIILAHTSGELNVTQKEIGSGAHFGGTDTLIPINQDYEWRYAYEFLRIYFHEVPLHEIRMLLNEEIKVFNPETIIIREGEVNDSIYLVLTGIVEMLQSSKVRSNRLSAGTLIGEISGIIGIPSTETYRACSYVQTLKINRELFLEFVKRNRLYAEIEKLKDKREFLQRTWLFGEEISYTTQIKIAKNMVLKSYPKDYHFGHELTEGIFLIKRGRVERLFGDKIVENITEGEFFGEISSIFKLPGIYNLVAPTNVEILFIEADMLEDIPIIQWKLFETFQKRKRFILQYEGSCEHTIPWDERYTLNIQSFDSRHKNLVGISSAILRNIKDGKNNTSGLKDLFEALFEYSRYHFKAEELTLKQYNYPKLDEHKNYHEEILDRVYSLKKELLDSDKIENDLEVENFLRNWISEHILVQDREYVEFLHKRGVY